MRFLMINGDEPLERARAWTRASELPFVWLRAEREGKRALGVRMVPAQVIVDPEGRVRWTSDLFSFFAGAPPLYRALDRLLDAACAEREPREPCEPR